MNPFRSLARSIWNAVDFRKKSAEAESKPPEAAPKKDAMARPAFRPSARGDGFDVVPRTAPVDLTGGVKLKFEVLEESKPVIPPAQSDFVASLDDLGLLIDELKPPEAEIIAPWEQPSVEPVDVFEYAAPVAQPLDFFEDSPPFAPSGVEGILVEPAVTDQPPVAAEPPTPIIPSGVEGLLVEPAVTVAAEPPTPFVPSGVEGLLVEPAVTVAAEPPTPFVPSGVEGLLVDSPPSAQPAVTPGPTDQTPLDSARGERERLPVTDQPPVPAVAQQAQFTVDLLMPVGSGSTVQRRPVEEFSTLELLDTVEQLSVVAPIAEPEAAVPVEPLAVEAPKP